MMKQIQSENNPSVIKTAKIDNLIDIVEHQEKVGFLRKENDKLVFRKRFIMNPGVIYVPPNRIQIPFNLPRLVEVQRYFRDDNDKDLFLALVRYHKTISELPDERYYYLLALWDMHTYTLEVVKYSPIICFDGEYEMGKTRTGTGMIYVAYRGYLLESLREAHIIRYTEYFGGAMLFDVRDFWSKVLKNHSDDLFLKRYEKGAKVPRVKDFKRKAFDDMVYYDVFGSTVIATNETVNHILESRGITINMRKSDKDFGDITPELALSYKERLVAFRARHYKQPLPDIKKTIKGRLGDITRPLFQIAQLVYPESVPILADLLEEIKAGKDYDKSQGREAYLLRAAWECKAEVENGLLPIQAITENLEKQEVYIHNKTASTKFKQMGFKTDRTGENTSGLVWDEMYLKKQMVNYSIILSPDSPYSPVSP